MYDDPLWGNTYLLSKVIANKGKNCQGAGTAILCQLIRNSKNKQGQFSPLKLVAIENEPSLARYYQSFGCTEPPFQMKMLWNGVKGFVPLVCGDAKPAKCEQYDDQVTDADSYFGSMVSRYTTILEKLPQRPRLQPQRRR
eukprot:gnl/MRDRNA2_/MRDRNA2_242626_c0_seq1.p1 gnl/MRDRNA2_/MRDRNA2_242626_c0~~gnl/MRDRNA2_/MRDRNA2_242626_c0_seq1.p1  ORF type:complete len:140 (-),score=20.17 gnl/MRDRNA2_/MRDRNA2_242626_c0_seq1:396-815(-)